MQLRLSSTGEKMWAARRMIAGKRGRLTIGAYPAVSLAEARKRATEYLAGQREGDSAEAVDAKKRALKLTITQAHGDYIKTQTQLRANTLTLKKAMFRDHIEPALGDRLVRTIRRGDVADAVGRVAAKGLKVQANRVYSEIMVLLRWCEQKGYLEGVPTVKKKDMRHLGAAKEQPRRRMLSDPEVGEAYRAAGDVGELSGDFLRLVLLCMQRRDEVRLMRAQHIDFDAAIWVIPASEYKTGIDHAVPLPDAAMEIIRRRCGNRREGYVLGGRMDDKPFNGAASAIRRLRKAMPGRTPFTIHDLRRTGRTGLSRLGTDNETAELVIGHLPGGMERVYNLYERIDERRAALAKWADLVLALGAA